MPLYYFLCPSCSNKFRKMMQKVTVQLCPKCHEEAKRDYKGPTSQVVETLDNGWMPKKVERLQDAEQLYKERSKTKND